METTIYQSSIHGSIIIKMSSIFDFLSVRLTWESTCVGSETGAVGNTYPVTPLMRPPNSKETILENDFDVFENRQQSGNTIFSNAFQM